MRERWRAGSISPRALALLALAEVLLIVGALSLFPYTRPIPALETTISFTGTVRAEAAGAPLPWPEEGQAALAVEGIGGIRTSSPRLEPVPIASTTKMMTALLILEGHPLGRGEAGPVVEMTQAHAEAWLAAILNDESAVEVRAGENLTLRQLLDGLLVASANNYARILAEWDAGSVEAFVERMNARAAELGMADTRFADPSGLSPDNVSTARDLLILAQTATANPLFAEIVGQEEVTLPVVGTVGTTNALLGEAGVIGVKTGETDESGGCLVFAADVETVAGMTRIYGVVLGQPEREDAFAASAELIAAVPGQISLVEVVSAGEQVGQVDSAWGGPVRTPRSPSRRGRGTSWRSVRGCWISRRRSTRVTTWGTWS
jgi:D-alanyl-D-alanine carboxypeptidase (penicillin-binding protein 5/6)